MPAEGIEDYIDVLMEKVGLRQDAKTKFPHEFSGGQRQRIGIARALALKPELLIADEPVSALDVSIQAQVLNLLMDLRDEFGLTILFISHDLKVIEHFCDRVIVMYLGHLVEEVRCDDLHREAKHPYTQALLSSVPVPDPEAERRPVLLPEDLPDPAAAAQGCSFAPRCPAVMTICREKEPRLLAVGDGHRTACFLHETGSATET